jgi:hypothetical protein
MLRKNHPTKTKYKDLFPSEQGEDIVLGGGPRYPWEGTDRDYKYEEVIEHICFFIYL